MRAVPQDILELKLHALHEDVGEVKTALNKLSDAITKLALVEQQQGQIAASLERAFRAISKIEDRVTTIEQQSAATVPQHNEMAKWIDRGIVALAGAGGVLILKAAGAG